jgi:hypothetical protein
MTKKVFFSIPLAGRRDDQGWKTTCSMLANTLNSIYRQTDLNFEIIISGHERPDISQLNDQRIIFIESTFKKPTDPSEYMRDKYRKKVSNILQVKERGGGYTIIFDADDLASKNLVKYIRGEDAPYGYIFQKGYVLDYSSGLIASIPGAWKSNFDKVCGSCAALYLTPADIGSNTRDMRESYYGRLRGHSKWEETAAFAGRPLHSVPFPAVIYVLNTSQNSSSVGRPGREQAITARIRKHRVTVTSDMIDEFSLASVLPQEPHQRQSLLKKLLGGWLGEAR